MNEGLRLSMGTLTRHPRIAPDRVLQYKDWAIPAGVSVPYARKKQKNPECGKRSPLSRPTDFLQHGHLFRPHQPGAIPRPLVF